MLPAMKAPGVAATLALCLCAARARGEPGAGIAELAPSDVPAVSEPTGAAIADPDEESKSTHVGDAGPLEPSGELVRIARLPQAELMVNVTIDSNDDRAYFEVNSDKNGASLIICGNPCTFQIWPGRYRLLTNASIGYIGGSNILTVDRDARVRVLEPHMIRPVLGVILGSLGIASATIGTILLAMNSCQSPCASGTATWNQVGFASLGAGLVIAPIGWMIFGQSRNPDLAIAARGADTTQ